MLVWNSSKMLWKMSVAPEWYVARKRQDTESKQFLQCYLSLTMHHLDQIVLSNQ